MLHRTIMQEALQPAAKVEEEVLLGAEAFDTTVEEYYDARQAVEADEMAIIESEDVVTGLESLIGNLEAAMEEGGLSVGAESMFHQAAAFALAPFGGADLTTDLPGTESFQEDGGREAATQAGIEKLSEKLEAVWKAIVKFIKDMIKNIQMFFVKHVALVGRTKKKADALAKAAKEAEGDPKEKDIVIGKAVANLAIDGKVVTDLPKALVELTASVKELKSSPKAGDAAVELAKAYVEVSKIEDEKEAETKMDEANDAFVKEVVAAYDLKETSDKDIKGKYDAAYVGEEVIGGRAVVLGVSDRGVSFFGMRPVGDFAPKKDAKVPALTKDGIVKVADEVSALCDEVIGLKKQNDMLEKSATEMVKIGEELDKILKDADNNMLTRAKVKRGFNAVRKLASTVQQPVVKMASHAVTVSSVMLEVASKSKSNLAKGDKKDEGSTEEE